ncbi:hypothetical protein GP486_000394 [Trichoglossum hirsutum]|uniref:DUF7892 domain-containing protein n=1 Tax=Trichoglossum hirsutum TaxID=265104 RepID=A0A9P8LIT6_9PEZI|nr:hypothetical protein GP486_000394 [Trichoglossum hirsutum]
MVPSCGSIVRNKPSSDVGSGLMSTLPLPPHQNGALLSSDVVDDDRTAERNRPCSLSTGGFRSPDSEHRSNGPSSKLNSTDDGRNSALDANMTSQPEIAGECAVTSREKKRRHEMAEAPTPTDNVAFRSFASSQEFRDQSSRNKRMKIDHAGDMIATTYAGMEPFRDSAGRLPQDKSNIPPEIWHHVFAFIPPRTLTSLLRVNRAFNKLLTPSTKNAKRPSTTNSRNAALQVLDADLIWSASRKLFHPDLPRPPLSMSELDMWRLLCGRACQFCGKLGTPLASDTPDSQFEPGPGEDGVKIIWQFGVRSCGACLQEHSEKEISMLMSSSFPSPLLPALPFILLTPNLHVITPTLLQNSSPPPTIHMTKYFYKPHIEDIKHRFEEVMALGNAASEEWFKGLDGVGKERMGDSMRCERWEAKGGLRGLLMPVLQSATIAALPATVNQDVVKHSGTVHALASSGVSTGEVQPIVEFRSPSVHKEAPSNPPPRLATPVNGGHANAAQGYQKHSRVERTIQEVNERKALRRLEIERRCREFSPPLEPAVLNHVEAFQAALHIPTPLTDQAWEILKPRILAQRDAAEKREKERVLQSQLYQQKCEERRQMEAKVKEAKEVMDREWDEVQQPIRERIGRYADEIIKDKWKGGELISKENSPNFAADVLTDVRQRFYAHIARDDIATRAAGEEPRKDHPDAPPTRKLILENMKWIFDTKIKPLTEHFRKELFLCSGCQDNFKFYGFEGVIQHYAAKHTNALSSGAVVVHWRAEWPEKQPFHLDPLSAKASFYALTSPASGPSQITMGPHNVGMAFQSCAQEPASGAYMAPQGPPVFPRFSPVPHGHPQYTPGRHPTHPHGPYAPPQNFQNPQGFQGPPSLHVPPTVLQGPQQGFQGPQPAFQGLQQGFQGPPQSYQSCYPHQYSGQPPPPQAYNIPSAGPSYGQPIPVPPTVGTQNYRPKTGQYGQPLVSGLPYPHPYQQQTGSVSQNITSSIGQSSNIYQIQLDEMATIARVTWFATSGIKDLPGSVRISVVIHHVVSNFTTKFANEPSLAMFMDGLNNHMAMKPIRSVNGLACKSCASSSDSVSSGHSGAFPSRPRHIPPGDRKPIFTLPTLLIHFQTSHIERAKPTIVPQGGITTPRLDWKEDMVELPEISVISGLLHAHGMDDNKLQLLSKVFPQAFPSPLPRLGPANNTGPVPVMKQDDGVQQVAEPSSRCTSAAIDPNLSRAGSRNGSYASHLQRPRSSMQSAAPTPTAAYLPSRVSASNIERRHPAYYVPLGPNYHEHPAARYPQGRRDEGRYPRVPDDHDGERYNQAPLFHGNGTSDEYRAEEGRIRGVGTPPPPDPRDRFGDRYYARGISRIRPNSPRGSLDYMEYEPCGSPGFHRPSLRISPTQSPLSPHNRDKGMARTLATGEGSEDGEVGDGPIAVKNRASSDSSLTEVNATKRFLQDYLPGDDAAEEYKRKAAEHDRRKEEKQKARWFADREADEQKRRAADGAVDAPSSGTACQNAESSPQEVSMRNNSTGLVLGNGDEGNPTGDWVQRRFENGFVERYERSPPLYRRVEKSPEPVDFHYIRPVTYKNERYSNENLRRPRSRYGQYETYRQERYRNRSLSPLATRVATTDGYYRGDTQMTGYDQLYRPRSPRRSLHQSSIEISAPSAHPYGRTYVENPRFLPYGGEAFYVPPRVGAYSPDAAGLTGSRVARQEPTSRYSSLEKDYSRGGPIYDERDLAHR